MVDCTASIGSLPQVISSKVWRRTHLSRKRPLPIALNLIKIKSLLHQWINLSIEVFWLLLINSLKPILLLTFHLQTQPIQLLKLRHAIMIGSRHWGPPSHVCNVVVLLDLFQRINIFLVRYWIHVLNVVRVLRWYLSCWLWVIQEPVLWKPGDPLAEKYLPILFFFQIFETF